MAAEEVVGTAARLVALASALAVPSFGPAVLPAAAATAGTAGTVGPARSACAASAAGTAPSVVDTGRSRAAWRSCILGRRCNRRGSYRLL